ncbi:hypothetical protein [Paracoccus simplex]|uniref:Uncharacterized protein n=1 Tax=Paracoccus simplex TaxID=2086346 RepID=A0ABV7S7F3_9RHOB
MARKTRPARLRHLAKPTDALKMTEVPPPKGKNPSARRVRRLARKGWLIGWPFSKGVL